MAQGRFHVSPPAQARAPQPRWAVRPLAAGEPLAWLASGAPQLWAGLSVLWRPANRLAFFTMSRCSRSRACRVGCTAVNYSTGFERRPTLRKPLNGNALVWPVNPGREGGTYMRQPFKVASSVRRRTIEQQGKSGADFSAARLDCFGSKALRRSGVACRSAHSFVAPWPNPSIEGTSTSKLRLLAAAPHVKR